LASKNACFLTNHFVYRLVNLVPCLDVRDIIIFCMTNRYWRRSPQKLRSVSPLNRNVLLPRRNDPKFGPTEGRYLFGGIFLFADPLFFNFDTSHFFTVCLSLAPVFSHLCVAFYLLRFTRDAPFFWRGLTLCCVLPTLGRNSVCILGNLILVPPLKESHQHVLHVRPPIVRTLLPLVSPSS